jgi:hypothetical protein
MPPQDSCVPSPCTWRAPLFFNHSFIHLRFFFSLFFKHTASAVAKQPASVSLNMLATEGADFN